MIGPARSVHGGISGVVNNYYEAGLDQKIKLYYIGTMVEGSRLRKLCRAVWALLLFTCRLPFYQIVHVNVASDASFLRKSFFIRLSKFFRKKIVIHQHGGDFETFYQEEQTKRGKAYIRNVLNMADVFLVLSPAWQEFFQKLIDPSKIRLFPNAVPQADPFEKQYGQQKILFLGRLCKEKGIGELFEVLPKLHQEFPKMKMFLGGIWENEELRIRAEEMKDYVISIGWVTGEKKEKYLQDCDIFVLPTYFEGQPVSVLEAMIYQCGIVASCVGGIPSMIKDGDTGILIRPRNTENLEESLRDLLTDSELCRRLGKHAGEKAKKEFSMDQSVERLIGIYEEISQRK